MRKVLFFLGELDAPDIDWFISIGQRLVLHPGDALICEGTLIDGFYIVLGGTFSVNVGPYHDREIAKLHMGDIVGEMSFIDAQPASATVTATEKSVVLALPKADVEARLTCDHSFAARFYRGISVLISSRLRRTVSHFGYYSGPIKVKDKEEEDALGLDLMVDTTLAEAWFNYIQHKLNPIVLDLVVGDESED